MGALTCMFGGKRDGQQLGGGLPGHPVLEKAKEGHCVDGSCKEPGGLAAM